MGDESGEGDFLSGGVFWSEGHVFEEDIGFGDDDDFDLVFVFDADEFFAFAVIEVVTDAIVDFDDDAFDGIAGGGSEDESHDFDGEAFGGFDLSDAVARRAIFVDASSERGSDTLSGHFDESEGADSQDSSACAIASDGIAECAFDTAAMFFFSHIDEVIDDDTSEVTESNLSGDGIGGAEIHLVGAFFSVGICAEAAAVDVDGDESFGLVDDE